MSHDTALAAAAKSAGKRPVADLQTVAVANLKPSDIGKGIRVRVYRKWTLTSFKGARQPILSFILLDQQGGAIQANVEGRERNRFDNILEINGTYTITGFGLLDTKKWMQTLPNHLTLILGRLTDVQPFTGNGFPLHHFNFASYNELSLCADNNTVILTDYIGCVLYVGDVRESSGTNQKQVVWRDIVLQNLEGVTVRFTLWNKKARAFDTDAYEKEPKPTVMVVSSCWVKRYGGNIIAIYRHLKEVNKVVSNKGLNKYRITTFQHACNLLLSEPPIPETDYILSMYNELVAPPVIQNVRTYRYDNIEDEKLRNRVKIDEVLREDTRNQTNVRFTVIATVLEVVIGRPWFFRRCRDCRRKIFDDRPHAHCQLPDPGEPNDYSYSFRLLISDDTGMLTLTCFSNEAHSMVTECNKVISEEGHTDPYTLPPHLMALEGTIHLFQLHFSTESTKENQVYILDTVMESGPQLLRPLEETVPANLTVQQAPNEIALLTGPEPDTQQVTESSIKHELPPVTPASIEVLQASTPITVETIGDVQERMTKSEVANPSVRRRLLIDDTQEETSITTKKTKQVE